MLKTISLSKLSVSPRNVRRSSDALADDQLKADIEAHGLLQNLVVSAVRKPKGSFTVEAGGRRLRALQRLAEEGKLKADAPVSCLVLARGTVAEEASLAENFQQLRMNPADECLAFQRLVEQGLDADAIAIRFGLTRRFVEGRLRLADLAPVVFEALGAGEIALDVAKAFAVTSDRDRQAYVFEQLGHGYGAYYADSIRRMMTSMTVPGSDRRARFVGEVAYTEAGGRVERDLFADDDTARWLDVPLLEQLATEKLEAEAERQRAELGIAFVRPTLDNYVGYRIAEGLAPVQLEQPPLTGEQATTIASAETEIENLHEVFDDEEADDAARDMASARIDQLQAAIYAIEMRQPVLDEDLKDRLGTFMLIGDDGQPVLHPRFYMDVSGDEEVVDDGTADGTQASGTRTAEGGPAAVSSNSSGSMAATRPAGLSARHADELAMQRRDVLAVHLTADTDLASDLAIFLLADRLSGYRSERSGSTLEARRPNDPVLASNMPPSEVSGWRQEASEALERGWCEYDSAAERFMAFRQLSDDRRAAWLGHAVAGSLEASLNQSGTYSCGLHDQLGELLGIEVASMWRPTAANYFDRVPKNMSLAALAEVGGPELAALHAKAKKAELATTCERIFAGEAIVESAVKLAALAWVPDVMRFVIPPWIGEAEAADETSTDEPAEEQIDWVGDAASPPVDGDESSDGEGSEPVAVEANPAPLDQAA